MKPLGTKIILSLFLLFGEVLAQGVPTSSLSASSFGDVNFSKFNFSKDLLEGVEMTNIKSGALGTFSKKDGETFQPHYYTRKDWGADESLRVWTKDRGVSKLFRVAPEEAQQWLPKTMWPRIRDRKNEEGALLTWPIEENQIEKKIVIHHTGEYIDDTHQMRKDPKAHMRSIYKYHTITRQWGDIGYNFVIDKKGNIYEGRAGGPKTVGAHVAYYNTGTIGIALMGNFEIEEPTDAQLKTLTILLAYLTRQYGINPLDASKFLDIDSENITGHKFVAREGHGTACPGKNLIKRLPEIRKNVTTISDMIETQKDIGPKGLDFLQKSKNVPKVQGYVPRFQKIEKKGPLIELASMVKEEYVFQRGSEGTLEIKLKNNTKKEWPEGSIIDTKDLPAGILATRFRSIEKIPSGESGVFRGKIFIQKTPNGFYKIKLDPTFAKEYYFNDQQRPTFEIPIQISGDKDVKAIKTVPPPSPIPAGNTKETSRFIPFANSTKVKLAFFKEKYATIKSNTIIKVFNHQGEKIGEIPVNETVKIIKTPENKISIVHQKIKAENLPTVYLRTESFLEITNYNRGLSSSLAYNKFRRQLNFSITPGGDMMVVNELPIEEYLWGLAEEPSSEPEQKKHAIHILARSYALSYSGKKRKFKTDLYDIEDDPRTSQFYLGYDWEIFHPEQKELIKKTEGLVVTYKGEVVVAPYFTQSNGRSLDIWKKQYPWTIAKEIPYDKGLEQKGHGVGLSGHAAKKLAEEGKNYQQIIDYFFEGIKVQKMY